MGGQGHRQGKLKQLTAGVDWEHLGEGKEEAVQGRGAGTVLGGGRWKHLGKCGVAQPGTSAPRQQRQTGHKFKAIWRYSTGSVLSQTLPPASHRNLHWAHFT